MVKLRSKKFMMITVAGLAALSVGSVAFASWVLGQDSYTDTLDSNVTVSVGTVTDTRLTVTVTQPDSAIAFDSDGSNENGTIGANAETTDAVDLSFSFKVSISHSDTTAIVKDYVSTISVQLWDATTSKSEGNAATSTLNPWSTSNYIVLPGVISTTTPTGEDDLTTGANSIYSSGAVSTTDYVTDPTTGTASTTVMKIGGVIDTTNNGATANTPLDITYTVTFSWGSAFGGKNPSRCEYTDQYINALKAFSAAASAVDVKIAGRVNVAAAAPSA